MVAEEETQEVKYVLASQRRRKWDGFLRGASRGFSRSYPSVMTEHARVQYLPCACWVRVLPGQCHSVQSAPSYIATWASGL